jgi:hypothetical protein
MYFCMKEYGMVAQLADGKILQLNAWVLTARAALN